MEIIDELEPCRRHIYTGSIGYFGFNNCLDLSIAIRTATLLNERLIYSVGGGIVYDSDPEAEYQETIDKGRTLQKRFTRQDNANQNQECVWLNGRLVPKNKATVSPLQPGFQYGAGLFETILSIQGSPYFLKEHLQRLNSAWQTLFKTNAPATDWPEVIHCTLKANKLLDQTAWVKILVAKGNRSCPPFDNTLMVQVGPYTHRLLRIQKPGLRLAIYPEPRQSPLAGFKTMNYLYCLKAGEWAQEKGCDEALILNPDGSIAETNSANVILLFGREAFSPHSQHVLPGVTQARIAQLLQEQGFSLRNEVLFPKDCFQANAVFLTNSLIGVVGAIALNGQTLKKNLSLACKLRSLLYSPDKY
jgi:para-aminobenzoate synthetase component 1